MTNKKMTPKEELKYLCDFSVKECVAHISEFSPGNEYFDAADAEVLLKHLQQTPDLSGIILDGMATVRRPGILDDAIVFYNRTEEELLEHLEKIPKHDHVHWMFKQLLGIQDEWLGKFRAALPRVKIVYSLDSDDCAATSERMLRVIMQTAAVKAKFALATIQENQKELQAKLNGSGQMTDASLRVKLRELEEKLRKLEEEGAKTGLKAVRSNIAEVKKCIELVATREKLRIKHRAYKSSKDEKDKKRLQETEAELIKVQQAIEAKEQGLLKALNALSAKREMLGGIAGKQNERDSLDADIKKCKKQISDIEVELALLAAKKQKLSEQFDNFRVPEAHPFYQHYVAIHVNKLYKRFDDLGKKHNIEIVKKPGVLVFGKLAIDYAHDRGRTWHPMPGRVKRLAEAYHGLMDSYRENIAVTLKERNASVRDIDVIMESGHHGVFFGRWQRLYLTPEEIRMQHVNTFYTGGSDGVKHVVFLAGMPFEPQQNIAKYLQRGKPARTRAGKPMASASHPVFVRNLQRSVSGMTFIRKHNHDLISLEPIMYKLFQNKKVLQTFKAVMSQDDSDNHFNSPEMDPLGTLGTLAMNEQLMKNPLVLYGQKVYLGGTINVGDTAEANSKSWREAHKFRRNVMEMVKDIPKQLVATKLADYESVLEATLRYANDMMGGSNENLKLTMRVVAWYFKKQFLNIYHNSPTRLKDIQVDEEGNHFANAVRDVGIAEHNSFEDWLLTLKSLHEDFPELGLKPFPLKIMVGGEPQYFQTENDKSEMVVHLGGYSVSRQAIVEEYGLGYNGKLLVQETLRVGLSHEPDNVLNKARNQRADAMKTGHTHESYLTADKSGDNEGRFIDQKPCTQRVSATELVYGGLPRTAGVDLCIYSRPNRYWKMTIPMEHQRRIGLAWLKVQAEEATNK